MTRKPTPNILAAVMDGKPTTETISPLDIVTTAGTQMRVGVNGRILDEYAEAMQAGDQFPPIEVYHDGSTYYLADGFHRLIAWKQAMGDEHPIPAIIKAGTVRDAILAAAAANARHGLRRTNADKRRSVVRLLEDPEWGQWSDREIARRCSVSQPFVSKMRSVVGIKNESHTDNVISMTPQERTYIHPKTGQPTTMNTANIGANRPAPAPIEPEPGPKSDGPHLQLKTLAEIAAEQGWDEQPAPEPDHTYLPGRKQQYDQPNSWEELPEIQPHEPPIHVRMMKRSAREFISAVDIGRITAGSNPEAIEALWDVATDVRRSLDRPIHEWIRDAVNGMADVPADKRAAILNALDDALAPTPPIETPPPTDDLPDWRDGWNDDDEAVYGDLRDSWMIDDVAAAGRPRVLLRLAHDERDQAQPGINPQPLIDMLMRRYEEMT